MSESEQNEAPQRVEELLAELAEVRAKRDQLDAQNLRVTDNLRRTIAEREQAEANAAVLREQVAELDMSLLEITTQRDAMARYRDQMRASRDEARKVSSEVRQQLAEMTASRDNFERLCKEWRIEFDALNAKKDDLQVQLSQWRVGHDAIREQLAQAKEGADMFEAENTALRDTIQQLRAKQIHPDLPGILMVIQRAAEQARELI